MKAVIEYNSRKIEIDVSKPIDISIAIDVTKQNVNAWYIDDPKIFPEELNG
jgi:pantothenate kinase